MSTREAYGAARAIRRAVAKLQRSFRQTRGLGSPAPAQLSALGTLARDGRMATSVLAERERLQPQSVTRFVAALTARGLIERVVDFDDRRRLLVDITAKGRRRLELEMNRRDKRLARSLAKMTAQERETLQSASALLERLGDQDD